MRLGKLVSAFGISLLGFGLAQAGTLEALVKTLEEKNLLTPQEAKRILSAGSENDAALLLAKLLEKKNILTPQEVERIASASKGSKRVEPPKRVEKKTTQPVEIKGEGNTLGKLSELQIKNLKKLANISISGKAFLHYDYTRTSPLTSKDDKGEFKVTRAYLEIKRYFENSKDKYFRLTTDIYQDDSGSWNVRLKYAYLNWKWSPLLATEVGLAHRPWIDWEEHHGWFHKDVDKTFIEDSDGAHLISSADFGIALKGKYGKLVDYMVGIYNGEGYHAAEDDKHFGKSLEARVAVQPIKGLNIAFHTAQIFNSGTEANRHIYQPFASYKNNLFLVAAQFIYDREEGNGNPTYNNWGYAVNGDLYLKGLVGTPITLFGRYGYWNFDGDYTIAHLSGDKSKDYQYVDRRQYLLGVSYTWNRYVGTSIAYKYVKYDIAKTDTETGKDYKDTFMAVMQVKW